MPKIDPKLNHTYGEADAAPENIPFRQRLMNRFAAHDWVRVINVDNEPFYWQYLPAHSETFEFTDDPMKITTRDDVEPYILNPGESEVVLGENAYVMIESLYKKVVSKRYVRQHGGNEVGKPGRNFNWTAGNKQEELIDEIFIGKETPRFGESGDVPNIATKQKVVPHRDGRMRK